MPVRRNARVCDRLNWPLVAVCVGNKVGITFSTGKIKENVQLAGFFSPEEFIMNEQRERSFKMLYAA